MRRGRPARAWRCIRLVHAPIPGIAISCERTSLAVAAGVDGDLLARERCGERLQRLADVGAGPGSTDGSALGDRRGRWERDASGRRPRPAAARRARRSACRLSCARPRPIPAVRARRGSPAPHPSTAPGYAQPGRRGAPAARAAGRARGARRGGRDRRRGRAVAGSAATAAARSRRSASSQPALDVAPVEAQLGHAVAVRQAQRAPVGGPSRSPRRRGPRGPRGTRAADSSPAGPGRLRRTRQRARPAGRRCADEARRRSSVGVRP